MGWVLSLLPYLDRQRAIREGVPFLLRSVKYGLYGAVLAGVVGGTVAWGSVDKTVTLVVDGQTKQVHTTASRVGDLLGVAGYHVGGHDLVAPAANAPVHD